MARPLGCEVSDALVTFLQFKFIDHLAEHLVFIEGWPDGRFDKLRAGSSRVPVAHHPTAPEGASYQLKGWLSVFGTDRPDAAGAPLTTLLPCTPLYAFTLIAHIRFSRLCSESMRTLKAIAAIFLVLTVYDIASSEESAKGARNWKFALSLTGGQSSLSGGDFDYANEGIRLSVAGLYNISEGAVGKIQLSSGSNSATGLARILYDLNGKELERDSLDADWKQQQTSVGLFYFFPLNRQGTRFDNFQIGLSVGVSSVRLIGNPQVSFGILFPESVLYRKSFVVVEPFAGITTQLFANLALEFGAGVTFGQAPTQVYGTIESATSSSVNLQIGLQYIFR